MLYCRPVSSGGMAAIFMCHVTYESLWNEYMSWSPLSKMRDVFVSAWECYLSISIFLLWRSGPMADESWPGPRPRHWIMCMIYEWHFKIQNVCTCFESLLRRENALCYWTWMSSNEIYMIHVISEMMNDKSCDMIVVFVTRGACPYWAWFEWFQEVLSKGKSPSGQPQVLLEGS